MSFRKANCFLAIFLKTGHSLMDAEVIIASRARALLMLFFSLGFVGLAISERDNHIESSHHFMWGPGLVLFSIAAFVFAWQLAKPQRLELDSGGFTLSGGLRLSPDRISWTDIEPFFLFRLSRGGKLVGYNFRPGARERTALMALNRECGADACFSKLLPVEPENLVRVLNDYRDRALQAKTARIDQAFGRAAIEDPRQFRL